MVICRRCGLIFPDPMPVPARGLAQHYDVDADDYFLNHQSDQKERQAEALLAEARSLLGAPGRLLDVGSGRGEVLKVALRENWDAVGLEPSRTFAERAAAASGAQVENCSLEEYVGGAGSFDAVILAAILEHVYDPNAVLGKIATLLRPGGVLFLDVPNEHGLYFRLGNLYQKLRGRDWVVNLAPTFSPFHTFGFGPRALRALLAKHSLAPVRWRQYGGTSWLQGGPEAVAARSVSALSVGSLGNYIEAWARRA